MDTTPAGWAGLDLGVLARLAQAGFGETIDSVSEAKTLLIDPTLAGPLGLISDMSALRERGVEKMFWLEAAHAGEGKAIQAPTRHLLYLCRPEIKWMRTVDAHMAADKASHGGSLYYTYTLAFVPHRTEPCLQFLRTHQLLQDVSMSDFGLEFNVLGRDVLSLEQEREFADLFVHGDHTSLFRAAQALMTVQTTYGLFPRIVGKGDLANRLCDLLLRQRQEHLAAKPDQKALQTLAPGMDALIILDRTVDLVTPLSTQLTYEGLIDEVVGIANGRCAC